MNLTTIQRQVLTDIAAGRPVGHEQQRASAVTSLKKRGLIALGTNGKWHVTSAGLLWLAENRN